MLRKIIIFLPDMIYNISIQIYINMNIDNYRNIKYNDYRIERRARKHKRYYDDLMFLINI